MIDDLFERWKIDNGWYSTGWDVTFWVALSLMLIGMAGWFA